jgi:hypothetical protein
MEGQLRDLVRQKIIDSLAAPVPSFTRPDIRLPGVKKKAVAVIGMRRTGKTELERNGSEITYVRTKEGYEVDFMVRYHDTHEELIQVCTDPSDPATCQREIRALQEAAREHPKATLHLVSVEPGFPAIVPPGVNMHSASAWLLKKSEE